MPGFFRRLFRDESGQDLVEYALLTVVVGLAGAVAAPQIGQAIGFVYDSWVGETNNLWVTPDPISSP
jgi:Flp pilus assembly pilin Flp